MTASAHSRLVTEFGELSCELRSVNHRYFEFAPRMPEELRLFESILREQTGTQIARGHVDCFIRLAENDLSSQQLDLPLLESLSALAQQVHAAIPDAQPLRTIDLLRWPGVMKKKEVCEETIQAALVKLLGKSLTDLLDARISEGKKIHALIQQRLHAAREIVEEIRQLLPQLKQQYQTRLEEKVRHLRDQLDDTRLEQEIVFILQKADIDEELDRLTVHIDEVEKVIGQSRPVGRRLDFLMQELNREANTLGAKSADTRLSKASVNLKVLIEQMREQVQNIE